METRNSVTDKEFTARILNRVIRDVFRARGVPYDPRNPALYVEPLGSRWLLCDTEASAFLASDEVNEEAIRALANEWLDAVKLRGDYEVLASF